MMEEGGSDVVKMTEESEEATSQLVVPNLDKRYKFLRHGSKTEIELINYRSEW